MSDNSTAYSFETDVQYLSKLRDLVSAGTVRIDFDPGKLREMDSPVVVVAETERWAMGMVVVCGTIWWFLGLWAAAGAVAVCLLAYFALGRRGIARNIERRIHERALKDIAVWRALWRHGGIRLQAPGRADLACSAPGGSWIQFLEQLISAERN